MTLHIKISNNQVLQFNNVSIIKAYNDELEQTIAFIYDGPNGLEYTEISEVIDCQITD